MSVVATTRNVWNDSKRVMATGSMVLDGSYTTGGISFNFVTGCISSIKGQAALPGVTRQPFHIEIKGISGYTYEYDYTNKKILIRQVGAATPSGTIAVTEGAVHIASGAPALNTTLGLTADTASGALTKTSAGALDIPRATLFGTATTAAFTGAASTAGPLAELPATTLPAGVTGDTIRFYLIAKSN